MIVFQYLFSWFVSYIKKRLEYFSSKNIILKPLRHNKNHHALALTKDLALYTRVFSFHKIMRKPYTTIKLAHPSSHKGPILHTPFSKFLASTFATIFLPNMNFDGHASISHREFPFLVKCHYLGKVVNFILIVVVPNKNHVTLFC